MKQFPFLNSNCHIDLFKPSFFNEFMGFRTFCDECQKEIDKDGENEYYAVQCRGKTFNNIFYCSSCFQKHWQGELPKEKE